MAPLLLDPLLTAPRLRVLPLLAPLLTVPQLLVKLLEAAQLAAPMLVVLRFKAIQLEALQPEFAQLLAGLPLAILLAFWEPQVVRLQVAVLLVIL